MKYTNQEYDNDDDEFTKDVSYKKTKRLNKLCILSSKKSHNTERVLWA